MNGFKLFPGGEDRHVAEESLDFAVKNEQALRSTYGRELKARQNLSQTLPSYFNDFQISLARSQADEDLHDIGAQLKHAEQKLAWEVMSRWKKK